MNLLMAYPSKEEFALSSLGYMWLYKIANETDGINVTRISTDNCNICSGKIDAIAFSLSFDFDFYGVFELLDKLNIPFYKNERGENLPLIFAGGPVITTNPKPYEDIFDFMIAGDGENCFKEILEIIKTSDSKQNSIKNIRNIDCTIFPDKKVKKRTDDLKNVIYSPIISEKSYFKNTLVIEIARGCMNRCAFCTASYTNLPFRNYEYEKIIDILESGLKKTNKLALLGAQVSAHPQFKEILKYIRNKIESGQNIELGISSLRADSIYPELIQTP